MKLKGATDKRALDWNTQGVWRRGRPRKSWTRTVEEETNEGGKAWSGKRRLTNNGKGWEGFAAALCSVTRGERNYYYYYYYYYDIQNKGLRDKPIFVFSTASFLKIYLLSLQNILYEFIHCVYPVVFSLS
jgi:hypothetical protein